jgi:hypothetical protein
MTMNPATGEGFDAVEREGSPEEYFDPNATDPQWPGVLGLQMRKHIWWQGDVEFYTYEAIGPVLGAGNSMVVSGPGGTTERGLANGFPAGGIDDQGNPLIPQGDTNAGTNVTTGWTLPGGTRVQQGFHDPTPCLEDDGSPTTSEMSYTMAITLIGAYGGDIKFPVMPEEFGADFSHEYWSPRIVGLGEIVMPGGQSMETIAWDSFFPSEYDDSYVGIPAEELESPSSITARLIWTMRFKMDCQLVVGGGIWNDRVVITGFTYRHRAGELGDYQYHIAFKRYRAPVVTTAPNPDALWDRWYKDPRNPVGQNTAITDAPTQAGGDETGATPEDPNPNFVPVVPDPPVPFDQGPASAPGREMLVTIETGTVQPNPRYLRLEEVRRDSADPEIAPKVDYNDGETVEDISERFSKEGPNDIAAIMQLNSWIADNGYDPHTSHLKIGSGVRYYKNTPVNAPKPIAIVKPNIGAPLVDPVTGQTRFPRGEQATFPGVPETKPTEPQIRPPFIRDR